MYKWVRSTDSLLKRCKGNERFVFFFESVGVPGGSPELGNGNSGWVPSVVMEHVIIRVARTIEHSEGWHDEPSGWLVIEDVLP